MPPVQSGSADPYNWKGRFLAGGRGALDGSDAAAMAKRRKKGVADPKGPTGEYAVASAAFEKTTEGARPGTAHTVAGAVGTGRAPDPCGISRNAWYHTPRPGNTQTDPAVLKAVRPRRRAEADVRRRARRRTGVQ